MYAPTNALMNAVDRTVAEVAFVIVPIGFRSACAAFKTQKGTKCTLK
jgi:hypothetical protein